MEALTAFLCDTDWLLWASKQSGIPKRDVLIAELSNEQVKVLRVRSLPAIKMQAFGPASAPALIGNLHETFEKMESRDLIFHVTLHLVIFSTFAPILFWIKYSRARLELVPASPALGLSF